MTREEVCTLMADSRSENEWNMHCDTVKDAVRDGLIKDVRGEYPSYWFNDIILSGLMEHTRTRYSW